MKPLVIYHANCADGFGAAFAAWLILGDAAEYKPCQYGTIVRMQDYGNCLCIKEGERIEIKDRDVYILDFSFPREIMDALFKKTKRVVWLDHHKTAFEMWCGDYKKDAYFKNDIQDQYIILDDNKSGAVLAWEYFHPEAEVPMLIKHIDDYDRWQFKLDGTKDFNKGLWSYAPWSFSLWQHICTNKLAFKKVTDEGAAILRAHDQNVQSVLKGCTRAVVIKWYDGEVDGQPAVNAFSGLVANCPSHLISDVGHELANQSGTFGLCWQINKDGKCLCSLRSNGDYDVSAIAKSFGGGGHKNAAGFEVPITTLLEWMH